LAVKSCVPHAQKKIQETSQAGLITLPSPPDREVKWETIRERNFTQRHRHSEPSRKTQRRKRQPLEPPRTGNGRRRGSKKKRTRGGVTNDPRRSGWVPGREKVTQWSLHLITKEGIFKKKAKMKKPYMSIPAGKHWLIVLREKSRPERYIGPTEKEVPASSQPKGVIRKDKRKSALVLAVAPLSAEEGVGK